MSDAAIHGGCLCGAVTFEVRPPFQRMVHCHCSRCRKATGTGHATNIAAAPDRLRFLTGEDLIARYDHPNTRNFSKWFCSRCGSPLPRVGRNGAFAVIPAGALDAPPPMQPSEHIFWGSRMPWACEAQGLPTHADYPASWQVPASAATAGTAGDAPAPKR